MSARSELSVRERTRAGLGKLGGQEINYGSDLDLMFVAEDGAKNLPKLQRIATEILDMLSRQTELGVAFVTDARLRPDGEKGLLVNALRAYREYYERRAQFWELQALSRRLVQNFHGHHDLSLATLHVHLDDDHCMEVTALKGSSGDVKHLADHVIAERGVRYGRVVMIPTAPEKKSKARKRPGHSHSH